MIYFRSHEENDMYDKHYEVEQEAYKILRKLQGMPFNPELITAIAEIRNDLNKRYQGEYYVEFPPINDPIVAFVIRVVVHTVH
jgi:hypothetical protein